VLTAIVRIARVLFKLVGMKQDIHQDRVGLVKIDDFETLFRIGYRSIGKNVLDRRNHVANRLNLNRFDGQYIVGLVVLGTSSMEITWSNS